MLVIFLFKEYTNVRKLAKENWKKNTCSKDWGKFRVSKLWRTRLHQFWWRMSETKYIGDKLRKSKRCLQYRKCVTNIQKLSPTKSQQHPRIPTFLNFRGVIFWDFCTWPEKLPDILTLESSNYSPTFFMTRDTCSAMTRFSWLGLSKKFPENYIFIIFFECIISNNFILRLYHVFKIWIFIIFIISWRFHRIINIHHLKLQICLFSSCMWTEKWHSFMTLRIS